MLAETDGSALLVGDYLADWLAHVRTRVRPTTYEGYEALMRLHIGPLLGHIPMHQLRPLQIQRMYGLLLDGNNHRRLSAGTVLNAHLALTQALGQAVRWGLLGTNPAAGAQPPRPRRVEPLAIDADLAERILEASKHSQIELAVGLALGTGMRRGEILGLRWADVDENRETVRVRRALQPTAAGLVFAEPKTRRSRRSIALPRFLGPYFDRQHERQRQRRTVAGSEWTDLDLVIDRGDGSPLNPDTMSSAWRGLVRRHGLPHVRFHDLRHAHATLMLLKGVHPKIVSERLGHASIGITLDTYSHVLPSMQTEAAQAADELFGAASAPLGGASEGPLRTERDTAG
jgi:integrase